MFSLSRRAAFAFAFGIGAMAGAATMAIWPENKANLINVAEPPALNEVDNSTTSSALPRLEPGNASGTSSGSRAVLEPGDGMGESGVVPDDAPDDVPDLLAAVDSDPQPFAGRLIGMHIDNVPYQGLDLLDPVESAIGPVEVVHWYQAWGGGHRFFRPDWFETVSAANKLGLITWEPWALTGEASQPEYSPAAILNGRHDDYIRSWAAGFAALDDGPWYLRPMHEMNGNWYPWSGGVAGGSADEYKAAWIYVHDFFTQAGVTNVEWVWCPLVDDISGSFEDYYPGDDYVDVLCLDGYNWGTTDPDFGGWRPVSSVFDDAYDRITSLGDQPVWFGEVGSAPEGGDKVAWTAELLSTSRYPRLEAVIFFGLDKERDWRVHSDPLVAEAIRLHR